jgi:riboflavin synthase
VFTGLVQESARIVSFDAQGEAGQLRYVLRIDTQLPQAAEWKLGASIALNGVCLTVTESVAAPAPGTRRLTFELSPETLSRTNFGALQPGAKIHAAKIHLETSLSLGDPLGGHLVSGHVDGVGRLQSRHKVQDFQKFTFSIEGDSRTRVAPFLVEKGSVAVDGVSLTVNEVHDDATRGATEFSVMLIPHTLQITRFGDVPVGDMVNLEADLLAKYVCRYRDFQNHAK